MYKFIYSPRAQNEVEQAIDWYEEQQDGLSKRFLSELYKKIKAIQKQPDRYAIRFENFRVVNVDVFPYQIIYSFDEQEGLIIINSVFHTKRNPANKYK